MKRLFLASACLAIVAGFAHAAELPPMTQAALIQSQIDTGVNALKNRLGADEDAIAQLTKELADTKARADAADAKIATLTKAAEADHKASDALKAQNATLTKAAAADHATIVALQARFADCIPVSTPAGLAPVSKPH